MDAGQYSSEELTVLLVDSLGELREILGGFRPSVMIGDREEGLNSFYFLQFNDFDGGVGLCSYSQGKFSGCRKFNDNIVIFNDQMLYLLSHNLGIKWKHRLDGVIYEVVIMNDKIFVVHEIGAKCFNADGNSIWSHSTDIVVDHIFDGERVILTTDKGLINISLIDGQIIV